MAATKEEMKTEALERMKMLQLHPNPIKEFKKEGKVNLSLAGMLYWLDGDIQKLVDDFEEDSGYLAYHVILNNTSIGQMVSILYVTDRTEEWEDDRLDLNDGYPLAYVINTNADWGGEYGSIGVEPRFGGLVRTA